MINIENINFVHFAGGEVHLNGAELPLGIKSETVWSPIHNSDDLMELLIFTDAYKRAYGKAPSVCIPYIPYARQDRVANPGEGLSIKVFADIINAQGYPEVFVIDPHSDVCMALLNNVKLIQDIDDNYLSRVVPEYLTSNYVVVAPDAGAYKKLSKKIKMVPLIYATKQRDTRTGALSNVEVHVGNVDISDKTLLIVDDICDGGGTFQLLAKELRTMYQFDGLELYVTHGIFSKGIEPLVSTFNKVYTTNSFYQGKSTGNLRVTDLKNFMAI